MTSVIIAASGSAPSRADPRGYLVFLLTAIVMGVVWQTGESITLTPQAAIVHRGRKHVMDWRAVAGICVE
jgi:hypothetical protein